MAKKPKTNKKEEPKSDGSAAGRLRINITMPCWLNSEVTPYMNKRGYGRSELITRLLEKFLEEEIARAKAERIKTDKTADEPKVALEGLKELGL